MTINPEGMDTFESIASSAPSAPSRPAADTTFEGAVAASRDGGANEEARQIATALYGGKPPASFIESVRQGLEGEDH